MPRIAILVFAMLPACCCGQEFVERVSAAVDKALPGILRGVESYPSHRPCFSCHHQAQPLMTLAAARARGIPVDPAQERGLLDFSLQAFAPPEKHERLQSGLGHRTSVIAYLLGTLAMVDYPPDEMTSVLVQYMLTREDAAGGWRDALKRPPSQGSPFTVTGMTLIGLNRYGTADNLRPQADRIQQSRLKALEWLMNTPPVDTEDRVFRLRGLLAGGAPQEVLRASREELIKEQRADGSWGQLAELPGDAYATGSVLIALHEAGLDAQDAIYVRGLHFLLETQQADGSWFVKTRAPPVQKFFDNGDPGGASQFICFSATNWATLALLEALPRIQ